MANRPSRAKMCTWVSARLYGIQLSPSNPADISGIVLLNKAAEEKIRALQLITSELGWHADASLDYAWDLIQEYDLRRAQERAQR